MNTFKKVQNYSKPISRLAVCAIVLSVILFSTISNVDAARKDPRFDSSQDCFVWKDKKTGMMWEECCWREQIPGSILGQVYCQICDYETGLTCFDKERQMALAEQNKPINPSADNDIVAENPTTEQQPSSPTSNPGIIVRDPLQQIEPTNDEGNEANGDSSENTQSNSENTDNSFTPQEGEDLSNSQQTSDSNESE